METLPPLEGLSADQLEELVRHHNHLYWDLNAPVLVDTDFDRLVEALRAARPESPALLELGPTQFGAEVAHRAPMLSLDKCYSDARLLEFVSRQKIEGDFVVTPKIDGVACSMLFGADGALRLAATRGDGKRGEDVTANVRRIEEVPARLQGIDGEVEVRGELYMRLSRFREHYAADKANPRNLTAGAIKQKDPRKTGAYGLSFFAYELLGMEVARERDKLAWLRAHGFTAPDVELAARDELVEVVHAVAARREQLDFEADGVVVKVDLLSEQRRLGATAHHPRYAIAFKFQGETGETTLLGVDWSVSRTGTITPVARLDPVFLKGVNVGRASLHNLRFVEELALKAGCTVEVARRGDVIPHVERVVSGGGAPIEPPTRCPSCGGPVERGGDFLRCQAPEGCRDALIGTLAHFTKVLDIEGFGRKQLEALVDGGLVKRPADFFQLSAADLLALKEQRPADKEVRIGAKLAAKLVSAIQARREVTLATFLTALGIDELGPVMADKLAIEFETLDALRAASEEQLAQVHGVGEVVARNVTTGLQQLAPRITRLLEVLTLVKPPAPAIADHALAGRAVVFTGKMATMERGRAQRRVRELGGKTPASVTRELDYLVIGDKGSPLLGEGKKSTKQKTAEKHIAAGANIEIVAERDFIKLLGGE